MKQLLMSFTLAIASIAQTATSVAVTVVFSATDKQGGEVKGLRSEDLMVREAGQLAEVTDLREASDRSRQLVVILDTSGSGIERKVSVSKPLSAFLQSVVRQQLDRAAIVGFDSVVFLPQDFTDDTSSLSRAIETADRKKGGGSAAIDAVWTVTTRKLTRIDNGTNVIVIVTDDVDNASQHSSREMIQALLDNEVRVYLLLTPTPTSPARASTGKIAEAAKETGGMVVKAGNQKDLELGLQKIIFDLNARYSVTYRSAKSSPNSGTSKLQITTTRKDVVLRYPTRGR